MIRVLQVIGSLNSGGSQSMIMNIYRNINKKNIQFDFIVDKKNENFYLKEIEQLGGKVYILPQYKLYNHFQYKKAWNQFFKEHLEYKIIHGHVRSTASIYLKIAKKYGLYTIAHSHNTSSGKGIKAIIKNILQFKIRYIADCCIGCSKEANKWLFGKKIANSDKSFVLPNAIDVDKYSYNEKIAKKIKAEFNIKDGEKVIGNIGRFSYVKNHQFLIDIFENLCKNEKCKLLLVGEGELKEKIEELVKSRKIQDKVIFTGVRKDINEILQAIDVVVMPSIFEGLPVTLIETQAAGIPCLISNNITKEVELTNLIYRESLKSDSLKWTEQIKKLLKIQDKENSIYIKKVKEGGYDIKETAKTMEKFYISKIN